MIEFHAAIFAWPFVLSDRPPVLWCMLSPGEVWDAVGVNEKMAHLLKIKAQVSSIGLRSLCWMIVCVLSDLT